MLPTDAKSRKDIPIYSGFIKYFPKAIATVAELSRKGNAQHNPGKPLHWDRSKSGDELDAQMRHITDMAEQGEGATDTDAVLHATKNAWRAMAGLEKLLETQQRVTSVDAFWQHLRTHGYGVLELKPAAPYTAAEALKDQERGWRDLSVRLGAATRGHSIPAAEREPADAGRATRWLMRGPDGSLWRTEHTYMRAELNVFASKPVCRIEA